MFQDLIEKNKTLAVIGLGYVGLPIALEFAKKIKVLGYDINSAHIDLLQKNIDPNKELHASAFKEVDISFTADIEKLKEASFYIVAVPTPVDEYNVPNLSALKYASETIGAVISKGDYVVFESTVYPGCTEEDCLPIVEKFSGLKRNIDFKYGYSPERINPGDKEHTISSIVKIVSGCSTESTDIIARVYSLAVKAGVHKAASIKVAEAAKVIENTQRDLNIALMNELSIIFDKMNINTYDVLEAAGTKWNFLKFQPGLVGGHCIGVAPYYLTHKSKQLGYNSQVILAGRNINDGMSSYVSKKILQHIIQTGEPVKNAKVLIMGATFKENVSDIRNSKVADIVKELKSYSLSVDIVDPYASSEDLKEAYGFGLNKTISNHYLAVIITVPHNDYKILNDKYFAEITKENAIIADLKGVFKNKIKQRKYWSL
ncbi:MAG: nucleotide sugar dehydrogenase [Chitinophagaceae bacterium]|nr:MAG: nucleotide sugar dehydrogenase [Chitinophagaceae bacterium]